MSILYTGDLKFILTFNSKYYSITCDFFLYFTFTQVVCDSSNIITHLNAAMAGSANDAYAFSTSALFDEAEEPGGGWDGFVLLGDSG